MADDQLASTFDELDQMATEARQPRPAPPPPPKPKVQAAPPPKKEGFLDAAKRIITSPDTYKGAGAAVLRAPGQLVGGNMDLLADAGTFIQKNIDPTFLRSPTATSGIGAIPTLAIGAAMMARDHFKGASLADVLSARSTLGQYGDPQVNQFVTEATAAVLPMVGGKAGLAVRAGRAAYGSAVGFSAPEGLKDRAANAALGAGTEVGAEALLFGAKYGVRQFAARRAWGKFIKNATPEEAASDALDRTFAQKRTTEARSAAQEAQLKGEPLEPTAQEQVPPGRHPDASGTPSVAADANQVLKEAGVAHELSDPVPLGPRGEVLVPQAAKDALDEAGLGRAFAAEGTQSPDAVIFKETAADGTSRVVGSMDRESLTNLGADVAHLRENPGEINLGPDNPHGQWTMAHLGTEEDTPALLRAIVESIPGKSQALDNAGLMQAAREAADQFGGTSEDALQFAYSVAGDHSDLPVALKTMQTIWARMGDDLARATDGVDWSTAEEDLVVRAAQHVHDISLFGGAFQDAKSVAGRGLQVLGLPDADAYLSGLRRSLRDADAVPPRADPGAPPPLPRTREELKQWLDLWNATDPEKRMDFLKGIKSYPSGLHYLRTSVANFFTAAIISAPKTILLNVVQPAFFGGLRTLERTSGAIAASINPFLSAQARADARTVASQAPIAYVQSLGDIAQAFKYAKDAFTSEQSILGGANPWDASVAGVPAPMIAAAQADGKQAIPYHLGNLINMFPQAVHRLHGTTNELALHQAYFGEVRAKAMLEAAQAKLSPEDTRALVSDRLFEAADNATGAATDSSALDSAQRTTMTRSADPEFAPGQASVIRTLNNWRKNVPELRYVLPILQVPANALGETIRRIPGAGFLLRETRAELSGELGPMRQAEAYGRMMLASGALISGSIMARQGMLTGAGPQDPHDRGIWLTNHQPYSLRIGNKWVAYDKLDPVGPMLALAAGHFDTSVYRDTDRDTTLAAVGALAQYLKDKAALTAFSNLLNIGGSPEDASAITRLVGSTARGFVPAFLGGARTVIDPNLRVKRTPWDYILDALPGASTTLDPQRNLLGEPIHKPQDTLVENLLPVTMSAISSYAQEPVLDELDRLYERTGYTPGLLSPAAGPQAHFDYRDVKLEDGFSLYNAIMKARTTTNVDGTGLKQALYELIQSPEYNAAPDGTGRVGDAETGIREDTRGGMVQKVFSDYTRLTKQDVAKASPIARRWMAAAAIKSDANDQLRGTPAKDIVQNPALLDALGISMQDYETRLQEGSR